MQEDKIKKAKQIAQAVHDAGGRALFVGGYARDEMMRRVGVEVESKDIDLEVYGIEKDDLEQLLGKFGVVQEFGKQYEVFNVDGIDVSLPRREKQVGPGHGDLETEYDPEMSFEEAFRRRDFTINAIGIDPLTDEVIDLYGGVNDIQDQVLRMVDPGTFADDPLRPLRAAQLAGRFGLSIEPETLAFARTVDMTSLPKTRIGEEWHKLLVKSPKPSVGLKAMLGIGAIKQLHPELETVISNPKTLDLIDRAASELDRTQHDHIEIADRLLMVLCRGLGNKACDFLTKIEIAKSRAFRIVSVVRSVGTDKRELVNSDSEIRNLSRNIEPGSIRDLAWLFELEEQGSATDLIKAAKRLGVLGHKPEQILTGKHLVESGMSSSPKVGRILNRVYQAQLDGEVNNLEEAKKYAETIR